MSDYFPPKTDAVVDPSPGGSYVVDRVVVQIVVAKMSDGHKVAELPCNPVPLLYPFDLASLCEAAVEQVGAQQETPAHA